MTPYWNISAFGLPRGFHFQLLAGDIEVLKEALPDSPVMERIADYETPSQLSNEEVAQLAGELESFDPWQRFGGELYERSDSQEEGFDSCTKASIVEWFRDVVTEWRDILQRASKKA